MTKISRKSLRVAGWIDVASGFVGAMAAGVLLGWTPQSDPSLLSYPFTTQGFLCAQAFFFSHHLALCFSLIIFALSGAGGGRRLFSSGAWLAAAGMLLLSLAEVNTMRYADAQRAVVESGTVGAIYGIASNLVGIGLILAVIAVLRARVWMGWTRWSPLVVGIATFVVLTPGMFGGFVIARVAIGTWFLLFAGMGRGLIVQAGDASKR